MEIKDYTIIMRIKKFSSVILFFIVIIVIKSIWEDNSLIVIIEDFKEYLPEAIIIGILTAYNLSKVKIEIKNITNIEVKNEALKWISNHFKKNNAKLISDCETKKIYLSEYTRGLFLKKKREDYYFVDITDTKILIEGPLNRK